VVNVNRRERPGDRPIIRRVLVTGGAGFIGSHVADGLAQDGLVIDVLDNLSGGDPSNVPFAVPLHVVDIRSDEVAQLLAYRHFDAIVHCAGQTSVPFSMHQPHSDWDVNVFGTAKLAALARAAGVGRLVYFSSGGAIYGATTEPANERCLPRPRNWYGLHKFAAEQCIKCSGIPYAILRPSNVYGPRQRSDTDGGVVAIFLKRLLAGMPLKIHGTGRQTRDFIYVDDVVEAVRAALRSPDDVLWNVATGSETSILMLAETICDAAGIRLDVLRQEHRVGDVVRSVLDPSELRGTGLWREPLPLREGLTRMLLALGTDMPGKTTVPSQFKVRQERRRNRNEAQYGGIHGT